MTRPDLVVLPELTNVAYGFRDREELRARAEEIPNGRSTDMLKAGSKSIGCAIVAGLAERDGDSLFDSAVVVDSGEFVGKYRKRHLYDRERSFFSAGKEHPVIYDLGSFRLGVQICLDLGFIQEVTELSKGGAQVIAHPANLSFASPGTPKTISARENASYILTANRVGRERVFGEDKTFTGQSMILAPDMRILALASRDQEQVLQENVDFTRLSDGPAASSSVSSLD